MKNNELQQAKSWWESINYLTKKRFSSGFIHPTDSPVDPFLFLDDETILKIYKSYKSTIIQDTIDLDDWSE